MQILSVELENVKSYEQARVEFSPGVNAIVGHNGAGKSTILEAIGFTLFDSLDYKHTEFVRGGAKHAVARVTFVGTDERPYQVVRRIGSSAHYYIFDPQLDARICEGKADAVRFLREQLGVEPGTDLAALFKDAVGVPQGTLTAAFLLNDQNRKKVFDALLRVEEYEKAWERLRDPASLLRTRRADLNAEISGMLGRLERLPELEATVARRGQEIQQAQRHLAQAEEELCIVQARRSQLEAVREELAKTENRVAQAYQRRQVLEARLRSAQQELESAREAAEIVERHQDGFERYCTAQAAETELDARQRQRQQVEAQHSAADKALALHTSRLAQVEQDLAESAAAESAAQALAPAVAEQAQLEQDLAEAQRQQARLEDAQRNAGEQAAALARLRTRLETLQLEYKRAGNLEGEVRAAEQAIAQMQKRINESREELGRQKSHADLIKEQSKQLEDIHTALCPVCEQPLTDAHRRGLLARNGEKLAAMRQSYAGVQREMREIEANQAAQQDVVERLQAELRKLPRIEELNDVQQELSRTQVAVEAAEAQVAQLSAAPARVQTLTRRLAELGDPRRKRAIASEQAQRKPSLEAQVAEASSQVAAAQQALAEVKQALAAFAGLDAELEAVAAELKRHQEAYQAVLSHRRVAEGLPARQTEVDGLRQDLADQNAEAARLEAERAEVAARFDAAVYQQVSARGQELQGQIGGLKTQIALLTGQQGRDEQEIASLNAVAATVAAAQARQAHLVEQEDVLETIRTALRQAGPYITTALIRQISDGARQIFSEIMQDYSRHLAWNENYEITLEVDGHQRQFAQLSGGEQMSAALAVRLALLREMSNIDVAFFDEPTANLDEQRREALARQILAVRGFRQIFVISHDDTFEQATQNLVRVRRVDGVSRVSVE